MPLSRQDLAILMQQELYQVVYEEYTEIPEALQMYTTTEQSNAAFEKSTSMVGMGQLQEKPEGDELAVGKISEGYTTLGKNRTFGLQIPFTKESVEDDQKAIINQVLKAGKQWAASVRQTRDSFVGNIINFGAFTAGHTVFNNTISGVIDDPTGDFIYDTQTLFDGAHPLKESAVTLSNAISLSLTDANLKTAISQMQDDNAVNERGERVIIIPDRIMVPNSSQKFVADTILNSVQVAGGSNNDTNVLAGTMTSFINPYMEDALAWVLVSSSVPGIIFQERQLPEIRVWLNEATLGINVSLNIRFGVRINNWRPLLSSLLSTS